MAPSPNAGLWLMGETLKPGEARFGWRRRTLDAWAMELALPELARAELNYVRGLALSALCTRLIFELRAQGGLGRFSALGERPGFVGALAASLSELRLAGIAPEQLARHDADLARVLDAYTRALEQGQLADRALLLAAATRAAQRSSAPALLAFDVAVEHAGEAEFVSALCARPESICVCVPQGDYRSQAAFRGALGSQVRERNLRPEATHDLARLQTHLFSPAAPPSPPGAESGRVAIVSSPGESREAVEVARGLLAAARSGMRFDRMAVAVRAVENYRSVLEEALARAQVPAYFADGVRRPAPEGRAFNALLTCAQEGLSARGFAEYLSLGVLPRLAAEEADTEAADVPSRAGVRAAGPAAATGRPAETHDESSGGLDDSAAATRGKDPSSSPVPPTPTHAAAPAGAQAEGTPAPDNDDARAFISPRRWERLLVDAAVIGGRERWTRRLHGLLHERERELASLEPDDPRRDSLGDDLEQLRKLDRFAQPILDALAALPDGASWADWLSALDRLARLALRDPEGVCETLSELGALGPVGPVQLSDVRRVLSPRLTSLIVRSPGNGAGRVFVAAIDELRGRAFDLVFVLGLAEKVFPPRIVEDALLPDRVRTQLVPNPRLTAERVAHERLALRLAVGAAAQRVVLSFPRFDMEHNRPRVPSFYGLEVLQAIGGVLPAFDELTRRADPGAAPRVGWPAPRDADQAIDAAEYDLAILDRWLSEPAERAGAARYLLETNLHLARALRTRWSRWSARSFTAADGFVVSDDQVRALLAAQAPQARAYSATSLAQFAACPYKFYLHAIARVAEREESVEVDELDARQRGLLFHDIARNVVDGLIERDLLPIRDSTLPRALELLHERFEQALIDAREAYAPAIERVFRTALSHVKSDLEAWLQAMQNEHVWSPAYTELVIDGEAAPATATTARGRSSQLAIGLRLSGAIDLVERCDDPEGNVVLRATDYKTGAPPDRLIVTNGGAVLQPLLYALALESMFPRAHVSGGRLYFCTARGGRQAHEVALNEHSRMIAQQLIAGIAEALQDGFLPAAPSQGSCEYCSYRAICGPYEEERLQRKDGTRLRVLQNLRGLP